MNIEQVLHRNELRRLAADDRAIDRLDRQMDDAEALVGTLCRDGQTVYYANQLDRSGRFTGRVIERASRIALIDYLIRNRYV